MKYSLYITVLLLLSMGFDHAALAVAPTQVDKQQVLTLEAAVKSMKQDYRGAETLYTRVIALNSHSIEAHVQRGLVRRSLNNPKGVQSDATRARALIDTALSQDASNANLYYQRSLANRMLKDFDAAERDLGQAIRLGKRTDFDNDFKAIALERKMAQ